MVEQERKKNVSCLQFNIVSSGLFKTWLGKEFGNSSQKLPRYSCVVQSVEQSAVNREVVGSSPITGASEGVSEQMRSFLYVNKNQWVVDWTLTITIFFSSLMVKRTPVKREDGGSSPP